MARQHPPADRLQRQRAQVAEAVHEAVCAFAHDDGFGHCMLYALAGYMLLTQLEGDAWHLQAGSASILADPPDGWWCYDASTPAALARGEFHCWLAQRGRDPERPAALVDFSTRHFHRMVDQMNAHGALSGGDHIPWTQTTEPPPFVWTDGEQSAWVHWQPLPELCRHLWVSVREDLLLYRPLLRLVTGRYRALVGR